MELSNYKQLLNQVNAISARYKKVNELTGEKFNVFKILNLESSEVRMHSAFIAELLNPKGSHGQNDTFLKLFIDLFCFKKAQIDTQSCNVEVEKHTGYISEDKTEGGRIDIVVTDKYNNKIIIENKIYAGDQLNQLFRYYNHSNTADLIYLTLDGKPPSELSKGKLMQDLDYKCLSYKSDILKWLELCRKEVAVIPIIREAITHYINLIKYLTNQTLNKNMQHELSELITKNLEESFLIADNIDFACNLISKDFGKQLIEDCKSKGLICEYHVDFNKKYSSIWIWKPEWEFFCIGFGFQNYDKNMRYGFMIDSPETANIPKEVKNKIINLPNNESNIYDTWWPWFNKMESSLADWSKLPAWKAILNGVMKKAIFERIDEMVNLANGYKL